MGVSSLAEAWGNGDGVAHMSLSEAKQQFDEETLRLLDPAAYHDIKAQEREEVIRDYIADNQQRQTVNRAETEERAREVLRDMLSTDNQVRYHDFTDRLRSTEHVLDNMERRHRHELAEARQDFEELRNNGLDIGGGHHAFLNHDGTGGIDENFKPLNQEQLELARKARETHPNATSSEQYMAGLDNFKQRVTEGAQLAHYRREIEALEKKSKPAEGDADYASKMEAYNRKWASLLKALPEQDRAGIFRQNRDAEAVYNQYKDAVSAMRLNDNVGATPTPTTAEAFRAATNNTISVVRNDPGAAITQPFTSDAIKPATDATISASDNIPGKTGLSGTFTQCVIGVLNNNGSGEEACFAKAPDQDLAALNTSPTRDFNFASELMAKPVAAQPVVASVIASADATIKTPKTAQAAM